MTDHPRDGVPGPQASGPDTPFGSNAPGSSQTPPPSGAQPTSQVTPPATAQRADVPHGAKPWLNPTSPSAAAPAPAPAPVAKKPGGFKAAFGKGFGAGVGLMVGFGVVSLVLSILSMLMLMGTIAASVGAASKNIGEDVLNGPHLVLSGDENAPHTLVALNISGPIGTAAGASALGAGTIGYEVARQIDALGPDDTDGLILLMDTPGGAIAGSKAMADAVTRYQERTGHKVMAYVQSMSASGGMYAMAPADEIVADYGTLIGSIGVIMGPFSHYKDVTALGSTIISPGVTAGGIDQEFLTQGKGKDFGNPFREMSAEERGNYMHNLEVEYDAFVAHVAKYRPVTEDRIVNELGAYMFDAQTAVEKGLVDQVMGRTEAFRHAAEMNGIDPESTRVIAPALPSVFDQIFAGTLTREPARVYGHPADGDLNPVQAMQLCSTSPAPLYYYGDLGAACN